MSLQEDENKVQYNRDEGETMQACRWMCLTQPHKVIQGTTVQYRRFTPKYFKIRPSEECLNKVIFIEL